MNDDIIYDRYARKSSEGEDRQVLSIDSQVAAMEQAFPDLAVDETFPESKSAFTPGIRPKFDKMISRIRVGLVQGIIAWHPNRLARNEIEAATITYLVRTGVIRDLKFVTFSFQNTPDGIWTLQIFMSQGQYESAKLGRETLRGMRTKAKLGHFPGQAPVGYLNSGPTSEKGKRYIYKDEDRFPLVRRAVELGLTGQYTISELHRIMARDWGLTTRVAQGRPISYSRVHKLFHSIFYTGHFYFEGELFRGDYPALMDMNEFERLQDIFSRFGPGRSRRQVKRPYIRFNGILRCGGCDAAVVGTEKKKYYPRTDRRATYVYYRCGRTSRGVRCHQPAIPEATLVQQFEQELVRHRILPEFRDQALDYLRRVRPSEARERETVLASGEREHARLRQVLDGLIDMRAAGELEPDDFQRRQVAYKKRIAVLEATIRKERDSEVVVSRETAQVLNFATLARDRFRTTDDETKRRLVLALGSDFRLTDRRVEYQPARWLRALDEAYTPAEAAYLATQTSKLGSMNERTKALASVLFLWCRGVDAIADAVRNEMRGHPEPLIDPRLVDVSDRPSA